MADLVLIEEEEIPRRVFNDRNNPLETMNATQLLREYRFDRQSILRLTATLEHDIEHQTRRSYAIPALLQVLIALRFFACGTFHSVIANVFKVHKSTVCRTVHRVALALCRQIDKYLQFPSKDEEDAIAEHFFFCSRWIPTHLRSNRWNTRPNSSPSPMKINLLTAKTSIP